MTLRKFITPYSCHIKSSTNFASIQDSKTERTKFQFRFKSTHSILYEIQFRCRDRITKEAYSQILLRESFVIYFSLSLPIELYWCLPFPRIFNFLIVSLSTEIEYSISCRDIAPVRVILLWLSEVIVSQRVNIIQKESFKLLCRE